MGECTLPGEDNRGRASDFDVLLDACTNQQRRIVLRLLAEENRALTVRDLTHAIAKHNHHTTLLEADAAVIDGIPVPLHHIHLPKLEAVDLVEYDPKRGLVRPTQKFDDATPTLSTILDSDPSLDPPSEA